MMEERKYYYTDSSGEKIEITEEQYKMILRTKKNGKGTQS